MADCKETLSVGSFFFLHFQNSFLPLIHTVCELAPLYDMLVKVVALTQQSESKCQNVCIGQMMNVCNYVLPYAVYCGFVWKSGLKG